MTEEEILNYENQIEKYRKDGDWEYAHQDEDELMVKFIEKIAYGNYGEDLIIMAKMILRIRNKENIKR